MRWIFLFLILFSQGACSLYQSDAREIIEKNKSNVVVVTGFDSVQNIGFECIQSPTEPDVIKGPTEVIDNEFEEHGYSSFLLEKNLVVYQVPSEELKDPHRYCNLDPQGDLSETKIQSAIRLGVSLLAEQKELD